MRARVAVAATRTVAHVAVRRLADGCRTVVVPAGGEGAALAPAPVTVLELPVPVLATLASWGVRTLGDLGALPRAALGERLGRAGLRAHDLARGLDDTPFEPWTPPPFWVEAQGLDWEIADLGALAVVLRDVLARLAARLAGAHLAAERLDLELALASGARHARSVGLAHPMQDVAAMLALLALDLQAHPPDAAVTAVTLAARPVRPRGGQGGLWQPAVPRHRDLAALLARLVELAGEGNVGAPLPDDSHRPDAFTLHPFSLDPLGAPGPEARNAGEVEALGAERPLALRRLRPPRAVAVEGAPHGPTRVQWGERTVAVVASAGPWRTSGEWWDTRAWGRDEWDVLLADGLLCRLARDRVTGHWHLDGVYD
jgi:protein ImuB